MNLYNFVLNKVAKLVGSEMKERVPFGAGWHDKRVQHAWYVYLITNFMFTWAIVRFATGAILANDPEYCRAKSIGDFIITPSYTAGCLVGKDRWNVKLN